MHDIAAGFRDATGRLDNLETAEISVRAAKGFDELPEAEKVVALTNTVNVFRVCEEAYIMHEEGRLDARYWVGMRSYIATIMEFPGVHRIWAIRRYVFDHGFQKCVDTLEQISPEPVISKTIESDT